MLLTDLILTCLNVYLTFLMSLLILIYLCSTPFEYFNQSIDQPIQLFICVLFVREFRRYIINGSFHSLITGKKLIPIYNAKYIETCIIFCWIISISELI